LFRLWAPRACRLRNALSVGGSILATYSSLLSR
jgi:hypothetical protein